MSFVHFRVLDYVSITSSNLSASVSSLGGPGVAPAAGATTAAAAAGAAPAAAAAAGATAFAPAATGAAGAAALAAAGAAAAFFFWKKNIQEISCRFHQNICVFVIHSDSRCSRQ